MHGITSFEGIICNLYCQKSKRHPFRYWDLQTYFTMLGCIIPYICGEITKVMVTGQERTGMLREECKNIHEYHQSGLIGMLMQHRLDGQGFMPFLFISAMS